MHYCYFEYHIVSKIHPKSCHCTYRLRSALCDQQLGLWFQMVSSLCWLSSQSHPPALCSSMCIYQSRNRTMLNEKQTAFVLCQKFVSKSTFEGKGNIASHQDYQGMSPWAYQLCSIPHTKQSFKIQFWGLQSSYYILWFQASVFLRAHFASHIKYPYSTTFAWLWHWAPRIEASWWDVSNAW